MTYKPPPGPSRASTKTIVQVVKEETAFHASKLHATASEISRKAEIIQNRMTEIEDNQKILAQQNAEISACLNQAQSCIEALLRERQTENANAITISERLIRARGRTNAETKPLKTDKPKSKLA